MYQTSPQVTRQKALRTLSENSGVGQEIEARRDRVLEVNVEESILVEVENLQEGSLLQEVRHVMSETKNRPAWRKMTVKVGYWW